MLFIYGLLIFIILLPWLIYYSKPTTWILNKAFLQTSELWCLSHLYFYIIHKVTIRNTSCFIASLVQKHYKLILQFNTQNMKIIFEIPPCSHHVTFITEFVLLIKTPPFYEVNSFNTSYLADSYISFTLKLVYGQKFCFRK